MFVFVKHSNELHMTVFGPATPAECRAWMRMKKLHPSTVHMSDRLLAEGDVRFDTALDDTAEGMPS